MCTDNIKTQFTHFMMSVFAMAVSSTALAQTAATPVVEIAAAPVENSSPYQEPHFYAMCFVAFVLLVFILQLSKLLSAVAKNYSRNTGNALKTIVVLLALSFVPAKYEAQDFGLEFLKEGFGHSAYNALAITIFIELLVVLYYAQMIRLFLVKEKEPAPFVEQKTKSFWDVFHKSVAIEQEAAILTDHNYDGIRELDNSLPPWWKYGFYLTIVFAFVYIGYYHVFDSGPLMIEELQIEEEKAQAELTAHRAKQGNLVDETTVMFLSSANDLGAGKNLFTEKTCAACHGNQGQGGTGPNLTDDYWMHGGSMSDIFKSIKYGWPDKGMRSWQSEIRPKDMAQITSYIKSIYGSHPPNPKEPQGDSWSDMPSNPTIITADSLKTIPLEPKDSVTKASPK
ncbi:MAG: cbb3-type cytochrome c oxidase N-terminal domain-containing protein [Flavobacteriales bacterium]|nr:cbb3-type cytochrome c oxidase N-terminal domain-containing protein [Flavobacteriales bacterium]